MQIGRKIYYDIVTGNILVDTGERSGSIIETTLEQDFASYQVLSERVPSTVGVLQFEYGEKSEEFLNSTSRKVNLVTGEVEFTFDGGVTELPPTELDLIGQQLVQFDLRIMQLEMGGV
jgi:hypothetical protein